MRLYLHLFLSSGCEAPGCGCQQCSLYLTNGGRNIVRACSSQCAQAAEDDQRRQSAGKE